VSNAVKFTDKGTIDVRFKVLNPESKAPQLECQVHDTGIGMPKEAVARIFEPFTQVDDSRTRRFGGAGLGLAVSKRLAEQLGGELKIESEVDKGTSCSFTCNIGSLANVNMLSQEEIAERFHDASRDKQKIVSLEGTKFRGKILVVEDCYDNQRLIRTLLKKLDLDITLAENGKQGYDFAVAAEEEGAPFDLIFMDLQMPIMDGYETTRQLRAKGYTRPIVALTANAMDSDKRLCMESGFDLHLAKPIKRRDLIRTLAKYLEVVPETETKLT
ncbi:MAG: ATP-binding protein, partial [Planctomycetia bacterium]